MNHYYIINPNIERDFVEVSEAEFTAIIGTDETRPYAMNVYRGELSIDEVPEDLQEAVQGVVDANIARWGEYNKQIVPAEELKIMVEGVL